jgi:DNA-binding response OmpR family regulator
MSTKRILLIHDDRNLGNLYREKLEGSGFVVDSTRNLEQAPKLIESRKPDLILIDLVLQSGSSVDFIKTLRSDPATMEMPILVFPTSLPPLTNGAIQAGATKVIVRGIHPVASVIDTVKTALDLPGLGGAVDAPLFNPDEAWLQMVRDGSSEHLNWMRHCLPGLVTASPDLKTLRQLWALAHGYAEKVALLSRKPLAQVAAAFDMLLFDLNEMPEQVNPSTLRTIGQAIDFLQMLAMQEEFTRDMDTSNARVLVVDDEESARQFIIAAMMLGGLKNDWAATPNTALEKLKAAPADLILLDVGLPEMNGFELCTKIRALDSHKKTPIVFLTGMATFQNKAQASLSGGNDFVGKPCNLSELALKSLIWFFRGKLGQV